MVTDLACFHVYILEVPVDILPCSSYNENLGLASSAAVRKEIADETDRETGRSSKSISTVPIHLSIYSPNGKTQFSLFFMWLEVLNIPWPLPLFCYVALFSKVLLKVGVVVYG